MGKVEKENGIENKTRGATAMLQKLKLADTISAGWCAISELLNINARSGINFEVYRCRNMETCRT